jgi:acyl-coenzyme A thioesterase PaaI-like protein
MVSEAGAWDGFHRRSTPLTPEQERSVVEAARIRREIDDLVAPEGLEFVDRSPIIGTMNALAAPMEVQVVSSAGESPVVEGRVTFPGSYQGPPGCVHGGFIAAYFDEVLGVVQALSGQPGMTANLSVNYRSPTPLHRPLVFRARIVSVEGRKIKTEGTLHHGETLCAEATAVFVSMSAELLERLIRIRQASE